MSKKFVQPTIPKFDGHYDHWSMMMENFLRSKDVEEAKLKDLKVKNFLFHAIDRQILETIFDIGTSKAIWVLMQQKYQGSTKVKRAQLQALRREFELLAMKEGEKVDELQINVEKEVGEHIACLRTDRGGEFTSHEFEEFCKTQGIRRQLTAAYTPMQNGVTERKNRMIMNSVRALLNDRQVSKVFWPESVKWCVHVQNRSPTSTLENTTLEEAWSNGRPMVTYFRVFRCVAHVHIPEQRRTKLEDKSKMCVFLRISDESKAYRLFDLVSKKIIVSRDVVFEEERSWDWGRTDEERKADVLVCEEETNNLEEEDVEHEEEAAQEGGGNNSSGIRSPTSEETNTDQESPVQGRVTRTRRELIWMSDYMTGAGLDVENPMMLMVESKNDPLSFEEAHRSTKWQEAMKVKMEAIEKSNTWELTDLPKGVKPIGVKWVFKTNESGKVEKHKARLVAKRYAQRYGIDYTEVFAPVARLDMVRLIIALATQHEQEIFQLDVKCAFLHGELKEEVFIEQSEGFIKKEKKTRFID
uniref:Retrovirus-related Pol polyprotein from transposon TNT 1-94 n=1 Tax=Cajanus cajan TaxID=3821 RepID=A0A151R708_CAJCA|nr:Retrovirus-related Pol polyprotein from transposon TNT 1-94 [Cajanus cajan]